MDQTIVDLLDGDVTVHAGSRDIGGQVLKAGERAVARAGAEGQPPSVTLEPITADQLVEIDRRFPENPRAALRW